MSSSKGSKKINQRVTHSKELQHRARNLIRTSEVLMEHIKDNLRKLQELLKEFDEHGKTDKDKKLPTKK
jgi:hypothetical protein